MLEVSSSFRVVFKHGHETKNTLLQAAKFDDLARDGFLKEPVRPQQLEFKIEHATGFLTIHSFAESDIKRSGQQVKKFLDAVFLELKAKHIKHLIVDLRDNTGGTDSYAVYFARHFFDQPFRYWDRIEVTHAVAKQVKGVYAWFYRKPILQDSIWLWQQSRTTREFDFYRQQQSAKNNYTGKTYLLVNGFCMSSCADVAAVLSSNKKAVVVGEEAGGAYQGNNSGMMPETPLPQLGFILTVPLQKYVNAVENRQPPGHGTVPDYPVAPTVGEAVQGIDTALKYTIELSRTK